jgi:predicted dehydrogenase/glycine/D-amino acid oxidase-like deaminating enzyme
MYEPPRIGLVGAGHFGREHLYELERLQQDGLLELAGIIVSTDTSREEIQALASCPVFTSLEDSFLEQLDCVDIATPSDTHFELIKRCLPHCHVLVEKPMCTTIEQGQELVQLQAASGKHLMVGHNYRFNPVIAKLKSLITEESELPRLVRIDMLNQSKPGVEKLDPNLEFLHAFDIMEFIFQLEPEIQSGKKRGATHEVSVRYGPDVHCVMQLGWHEKPTKRKIRVVYPGRTIICDVLNNTIYQRKGHNTNTFNLPHESVSLRRELESFLEVVQGKTANPVPPELALNSIRVASQTSPKKGAKRPRVAVVGGGVFGTNCALELGQFCDVTLFERHADFMEEVSFINQWRHHSGFHYPRSYDTVQEIRSTRESFESLYRDAIIRDYPSYFCPSAYGVEIPAERYVAACTSNYLSFTFEYPPENVCDRNSIGLSLRSDEGVYDYYRLREIIAEKLRAMPSIDIRLGSEVTGGSMRPDGTKQLTIKNGDGTSEMEFDYLINATYANRNLLATWFGFPVEPLRFDLYEMLVLKLPVDQVCVTILDGPFTSLVGMGKDNLFLLSHIHASVLKSDVPDDGMPPDWGEITSNRHNMLLQSSRYLPILKQAEVVESRYATRAVNAFARDFDARPTVIRDHGFGCWSILGGKVITCVSNAREIAGVIKSESVN